MDHLRIFFTLYRTVRDDKWRCYCVEWCVLNPERDVLRARIRKRLIEALDKGLIGEVQRVQAYVGDDRLNELGLEYKVIGEYLRNERTYDSLLPTLSSRLWHYARHQKAWIRKLELTSPMKANTSDIP